MRGKCPDAVASSLSDTPCCYRPYTPWSMTMIGSDLSPSDGVGFHYPRAKSTFRFRRAIRRKLANLYDVDIWKDSAGLLHDMAKEFPLEEQRACA